MKVAFDSRPARDLRGIGRYARCLLAALQASGEGEIVETHDPRRCEVFHSPWLQGTMLRCPVPMVVTLHDLVPLKRRGEYLRTGLRFKLRYLAVERAARIIVPTQVVARDAERELGVTAARIAVIPEAPDPVFHPRPAAKVDAVRERFSLPPEYLVWVGGLRTPDPRKRVAALARAKRTLPLVLVGTTSRWARELPDVQLTGAVDDEDLAAIYTGAHALVFPSDEEGFGLPPIEALACGTPVAACDVPALREVLDGRVALSDIDDLDGLVRDAEALTRPAPAVPSWSWEDAARDTWAVYRAAASASPARMRGAQAGGRSPKGGRRRRRA